MEMNLTKYITYPSDGIILSYLSNEIETYDDKFTYTIVYKKENVVKIIRVLLSTIEDMDEVMKHEKTFGRVINDDERYIYEDTLDKFMLLYGNILIHKK
jgi:hypothetical protein